MVKKASSPYRGLRTRGDSRHAPEGYSVRAPTADDAGAVAELIAACQLADGGRTEMTVEELVGDWQESEPSEEAVVVTAPDGRMAA